MFAANQRHAEWDVIVVGGGHAGIEAATASARLGAQTLLVSGNLDTIGKMSCNPSIGGTAKGQLAREIDALGGVMGRAADATGIHFKMLGRSQGPALWAPRVQCDKAAYALWTQRALQEQPNLRATQGEAWELFRDENGRICAVGLRDGRRVAGRAVVLTTGTFLQGLMHQGEVRTAGGRMGDAPAQGLSAALLACGLRLNRHKTGTPCRLHADTIDWAQCHLEPGEDPPPRISFVGPGPQGPMVLCYSTTTTPAAHAVIRANLDRAPMYNGQIRSLGPRYCPSIEDKVTRFSEREQHPLFLEPEGLHTKEIYVAGLSTSLPIDVQDQVLAAIPALATAHVLRYAYAVEYDVVAPDQIGHDLQAQKVPGLFIAGQLNGTSGYEEAAAQGLMAGANAALAVAGRPAFILGRGDAYIGVLIDDLVSRQPEEPYRMFTSRAEHRLHLRADNADRRLTQLAAEIGLVPAERGAATAALTHAVTELMAAIPAPEAAAIAGGGLDFPKACAAAPQLAAAPVAVATAAWCDLRYVPYVARQRTVIDRLARHRDLPLPTPVDWVTLPGISTEARQILAKRQPRTLGEVTRLPGVSCADAEWIEAWMHRRTG